jgi:hypothetical protein
MDRTRAQTSPPRWDPGAARIRVGIVRAPRSLRRPRTLQPFVCRWLHKSRGIKLEVVANGRFALHSCDARWRLAAE